MAGNNGIQSLRGTEASIEKNAATQTLLDGQLLYHLDTNQLSVGGGATGNDLTKLPLKASDILHTDVMGSALSTYYTSGSEGEFTLYGLLTREDYSAEKTTYDIEEGYNFELTPLGVTHRSFTGGTYNKSTNTVLNERLSSAVRLNSDSLLSQLFNTAGNTVASTSIKFSRSNSVQVQFPVTGNLVNGSTFLVESALNNNHRVYGKDGYWTFPATGKTLVSTDQIPTIPSYYVHYISLYCAPAYMSTIEVTFTIISTLDTAYNSSALWHYLPEFNGDRDLGIIANGIVVPRVGDGQRHVVGIGRSGNNTSLIKVYFVIDPSVGGGIGSFTATLTDDSVESDGKVHIYDTYMKIMN